MPTYQYACRSTDCGNRFELVQSFTDPAASECPVCAGPVRKVYSSVGVVFKGSGFYRTDSRAEARNGRGSGSGSESASSESKSETKSETKSESPSSSSSSDSSSGSSSGSPSGSSSGSGTPAKAAATS